MIDVLPLLPYVPVAAFVFLIGCYIYGTQNKEGRHRAKGLSTAEQVAALVREREAKALLDKTIDMKAIES